MFRSIFYIVILFLVNTLYSQVFITVPYEPKAEFLKEVPQNGKFCSSPSQYETYTKKNIPACMEQDGKYVYNWYAFKVGQFSDVESGDYKLVNDDDKESLSTFLANRQSVKVWTGYSKNEFGFVNKTVSEPMSSACVILKLPTPRYFYRKEVNYTDVKYLNETKRHLDSLGEGLTSLLTNEQLVSTLLKNSMAYEVAWDGKIEFNSTSHKIEVGDVKILDGDGPTVQRDLKELKGQISETAAKWAGVSYLVTRVKNQDYRLSTIPLEYRLTLDNRTSGTNEKMEKMTFNLINSLSSSINKDTRFTKNTELFYNETKLVIKVMFPHDTLTSSVTNKRMLNEVRLPKLYNLSPALSVFGTAYHHVSWNCVTKKPKPLGKVLPIIGCTSVGVATVSYLLKQYFYSRYLNDPYNQSNAYRTANFAQKAMVISGLTWLCVVPLDLTFTIRQMKRTKSWIQTNSL